MSVVGFDIGNMNAVVSVARQGGIEVLANEYNYRVTPCVVSMSANQRYLGEAGRNQEITNCRNTITQFKRLLGCKYRNSYAQAELAKVPFKHIEMPDGGIGIQVSYRGEDQTFIPEQIYAMFLTKLKQSVEREIKKPVVDVVISCSNWFSDAQRQGIMAAAQIAGLNCVRLLNDTTAAALAYGIYKQDLPEDETKPRHVALVDMGHSSMQVAICAFVKGKLMVKSTASDVHLGGRDFDWVLYEHFKKEFQEKTKIDIDQNARARIRMLQGCERVKKLLSANAAPLPFHMECLCDDHDFSSRMDRATFEQLSQHLLARVEGPLHQALADAQLTADQLDSVELIGGSMRIPAVKDIIVKVFGRDPSTTLNADEAVSRGCALQAAILSPTFRVREFAMKDSTPYGVNFAWKGLDGVEMSNVCVFPKHSEVPITKLLSFKRAEDLEIIALYENPAAVPDCPEVINSFKIVGVHPDKDGNMSKFKVKVRINPHGIVCVDGAYLVEEMMVEVKDEAKPMDIDHTKKDKAEDTMQTDEKPPESQPAAPAEDKMDTDAVPEAQPSADRPAEPKMKKVTRRIDLQVEYPQGHTQADLTWLQELEANMALMDHMEVERLNAKNAVEEYVYETRSQLSEALAEYVSEKDKDELQALLTHTEEWLYDEGNDEVKKVYQEKLEAMTTLGNPIVRRSKEWQEIPKAEAILRRSLVLMRKVVAQYAAKEEKYSHLDQVDIDKVVAECDTQEKWLNGKMAENAARSKHEDPAVLAKDIHGAREALERACNPIISKPKPKPPTPPPASPAKEEPKAENEDTGMDAAAPEATKEEDVKRTEMETD